MKPLNAVILAAGLGTRMKSTLPKVMHPLGGRPMILYAVEALSALSPQTIVAVIGHGADLVRTALGERAHYALQAEQLGTGHALRVGVEALPAEAGDLLVTYGDMPFLTAATLETLLTQHRQTGASATLLTAHLGAASHFGRIIRQADGRFEKIVEYKDATPAERANGEVNAGVYCFDLAALRQALPKLTRDNAQGEYYLTDLFPLLMASGGLVEAIAAGDPAELAGPNDRIDLAAAEAQLRANINRRWMENGVTLIDPAATYIEPTVEIGRDTIIYPGTVLRGKTVIGEGCRLGPNTEIIDSHLGKDVEARQAAVEGSVLADGESVGPYAFLARGKATIGKMPKA